MERMRSPSIYLEEPLRDLTRAVVPHGNVRGSPDAAARQHRRSRARRAGDLGIARDCGTSTCRTPSTRRARCPGYFPPGRVDGPPVRRRRRDRQSARRASPRSSADLIIAVDVGSTDLTPMTDAMSLGFANIYMRAATTMMHALQQFPLTHWNGPPMVLIRPRCGEDWLSFTNIAADDQRGPSRRRTKRSRTSTRSTISRAASIRAAGSSSSVDRDKCIGCGLCVVARAEPHGARRAGQGVPAHAHGRLVAGRRRFRALLPDARDHRAEDRAHRADEGGRARRRLAPASADRPAASSRRGLRHTSFAACTAEESRRPCRSPSARSPRGRRDCRSR